MFNSASAASNHPIQTPGINDVYEYNEVHLSSVQRDAGTTDHPEWNIQPELHNVLGVKIVSAQIPFTFYTIVDSGPGKNNTLRVTRTDGISHLITIAPGVYDVWQLADALSKPEHASSGINVVHFEWLPQRGRYRVDFLASSLLDKDARLNLVDNPLADLIGFPRADVYLNFSDANQRIAPSVANVAGPNALYIVSNALSGRISRNVRCNGSSTPNPPVVAKVPVNCNFGQVIVYTDPNPAPCFDMSMGLISRLDFQIIHADTLTPLQLNGVPWSITVQVLTQRDTSVTRARDDGDVGRKRLRT